MGEAKAARQSALRLVAIQECRWSLQGSEQNVALQISVKALARATKREHALAVKTLAEVHREYLASRGVTVRKVKRADGSFVDRAELSQNAKIKAITARDYVDIVSKLLVDWSERPMSSITRDCIEQKHQNLSERSPARANLVMRYLRALFNFASEYRDSNGQPLIPDNPVRRLTAKRLWNRIDLVKFPWTTYWVPERTDSICSLQ